jgi:hypothetical protein
MKTRVLLSAAFAAVLLAAAPPLRCEELKPLLAIEKKGFEASVGLLMNVWLVPYAGDDCYYGDPVLRPGVDIHRTTVMFRGKIPYGFDLKADLTLGIVHGDEGDFEAVEIGYTPVKGFRISGGYSHHAPFTAVAMTDHQYLLFTARPMGIEYMIPKGQPGLRLETSFTEYFLATAGLFAQTEWEKDFLLSARVLVTPLKRLPLARWGFDSTDEAYDEFRFGFGGSVMSYAGDVGRISGLAAELTAVWKFISFSAEFIFFKHVTSGPAGPDTLYDTKTAYGQMGFVILKDLLSLGGRYQWYDGHLNAGDKVVRQRITAGLYLMLLHKRIRLSFEYIHQIDMNERIIEGEKRLSLDNEMAIIETRVFL